MSNGSPSSPLSPEMEQRLARLGPRTPTSPPRKPATAPLTGASTGTKKRRRSHPAKKSRLAALALSLVSTGGLAATFAATDGPAASIVIAQGGVISPTSPDQALPDTSSTSAASPSTPATRTPTTPATTPTPAPTQPVSPVVVNGDVFSNKWGPIQVQVTFAADGSLSSVDAIQLPTRDSKSIRINDRAVPTLNSEALTAQTAKVDTVSGATYTSTDYERSLQSAIDAARVAGITQLA